MPVKCHLSRLMGEHRMTIQDVHEKTGLSRNTISMLYNEKVKRVDFDTLETLCALFKCSLSDLIELIPDDEKKEGV